MSIFDEKKYSGNEIAEFIKSNKKDKMSELDKNSRRLFMLKLQDLMSTEAERVAPDTHGVDGIFIRSGFISFDMSVDFPVIAREFLKNVPSAIQEDDSARYAEAGYSDSDPETSFNRKILSKMLYAARSGDEYTVKLFRYLYQRYFKREYKQLKRFRTMKSSEVMALAEEYDREFDYTDRISRILTISRFYNIRIDPDCSFLYLVLAESNSDMEKRNEKERRFRYEDEEFKASMKRLDAILEEEENDEEQNLYNRLDVYNDHEQFKQKALQYLGYNREYISWSCDDYVSKRTLAVTDMILKRCFPKRQFNFEELQHYASDYISICAITTISEHSDDYLDTVLGHLPDYILDESDFQPGDFAPVLSGGKASLVVGKKEETGSASVTPIQATYDQAELLKEIEGLREKLHDKEYAFQNMREQYMEQKNRLKSAGFYEDKYREEHAELVALREHVYALTDSDIPSDECGLDEMVSKISGKHLVIIGGHDNWVNKLRSLFPKWTFVNSSSTTSISDSILDHADYVYFFTGVMKHHVYYRFINLVRERQIRFDYIHSSNTNNNISQIYHDLMKI